MSEHEAKQASYAPESNFLDGTMDTRLDKTAVETEAQENNSVDMQHNRKFSAFASLGLLDRFLAVWIFLAMAIGIILGNFVPSMSPALAKGTFVGVSIPIGKSIT
jgi:ACR3 family arsenite transporter